MKYTIAFLLMIMSLTTCAQTPTVSSHLISPKTNWQYFGFKKQPKQAAIGYYKSDSLGYEPAMLEVYNFNKDGHLTQKYIRIFGEYASETVNNYIYNNGVLDSINTLASARNFNSKQKLHYDNNQQLSQITATGKFAKFVDNYEYKKGLLASIKRTYPNVGSTETFFNHKRNYIHKKERNSNGKVTDSYTVYDGVNEFASFYLGREPVVTFFNAYHRADLEVEVYENALNYTLKMRELKKVDFQQFLKLMGTLQGKPSTKTTLVIPVEATNEVGDWIKRLQIDKRYGQSIRRLVFKKLIYEDGTKSGSTAFDILFDKKVSQFK